MQVDSRHRFENYVTGSANRLAVAAARAVAEQPGLTYNPLFIYSSSGLGKTHLMGAIGNLVIQREPNLGVEYVSLEDFVEQLHAAIAANEADRFKQRYGRVDVLLLDDVQFLTGRRETQTELLRLLNALQGTGRQVVMTSDRPPAEIPDVDERLITRLSGGLIVDIGAPDYETRLAILRARCGERGIRFQSGVIEELATLEFGNIRELNGALNKLIATQTLGGSMVQPQDVSAMFSHVKARTSGGGRATPPPPSPADFQSFVSDIATAVAEHVDPWKIKVAEAVAYWGGEGYRTAMLDRLLQAGGPDADYEGALRQYFASIEQLRELEGRASAIDGKLGASEVFRDPERLTDAESLVARAMQGATPPPGPSAEFARAEFEVGVSNQLAVRAADAVIEEPGKRYNPLFVHGPSGVGKTHLINAVGNEIINVSGGAAVVACVSAQQFMDELIAAMQDGSVDRFRSRYRTADALVIDDVQFVVGKERTQEELFHVFNALHSEGKQLVFASDRQPSELDGLEERLRSRFEGGLVVEMQVPDRALRHKLYAHYLREVETPERDALLNYLADRSVNSVREIFGVVKRLIAAADVAGIPLLLNVARVELEGGVAAPSAPGASPAGSDVFFLDDEKVVWHLPDLGARLIEDPH
ncbi:MAG TPA: DnaA/Hda family protein [Gemmatimonadaceae bacterium]|nr:DnaA/Hda family protein [Gemmatimonadaceae bacterium]